MDRAEAIKAMKSLQDNLGVDRSEENLTTEAATHEIRTETHGVCSDLISRQAAAEEFALHDCTNGEVPYFTGMRVQEILNNLPPADTDMSEYSDRLWKIAYERGKAEGQKQVASKLKNLCDSLLTGDTAECKEHKSKLDLIRRQAVVGIIDLMLDEDTAELIRGYIDDLPSVTPTERTGWIPCGERLPKNLDEVNVTWVNHNPPVYYEHIMGKPNTGFAVRYDEKWYWWDSTIVDTLAEYGNQDFLEPIDKGIEIIAWMPMPEPYKGGDTE